MSLLGSVGDEEGDDCLRRLSMIKDITISAMAATDPTTGAAIQALLEGGSMEGSLAPPEKVSGN